MTPSDFVDNDRKIAHVILEQRQDSANGAQAPSFKGLGQGSAESLIEEFAQGLVASAINAMKRDGTFET